MSEKSSTPRWDAILELLKERYRALYDHPPHKIVEIIFEIANAAGTISNSKHYQLSDGQDGSALVLMGTTGLLGFLNNGRHLTLGDMHLGPCKMNERGMYLPGTYAYMAVSPNSVKPEDLAGLFCEHGLNKLERGNLENPDCHPAIHKLLELCGRGGYIRVRFLFLSNLEESQK